MCRSVEKRLTRSATHAMKAVRVGTRKVMTVASDMSRYDSESKPAH